MFDHLQIYDARERLIVGSADAVLRAFAAVTHLRPTRRGNSPPERILLLRLERIGDLLMILGALESVRARAPRAEIHLVVGSWNESLARLIPGITSVEALDAPWLARGPGGASTRRLMGRARAWRAKRFDLAINFEPDIRSNALLALSGAARKVGYFTGGGGALLNRAEAYVPHSHTAANAERLVEIALPFGAVAAAPATRLSRLQLPGDVREQAGRLLGAAGSGRVFVGLHASGGRPVKQWHPDRFAQVATLLARDFGATIVLTGTREDKPLVDRVAAALPPDVRMVNVCGAMELPVFAGLLERLGLFVTGDTGPMHLAAAVGTPVVAIFGPSDPARYGPLTDRARIVTIDLWCRPCNRVRRPPARCTGRVPDCLNGISVEMVYGAAADLLGPPASSAS